MNHHPLLNELLQVCATHDVDPAKAFITFEVYQELCEVRKLCDLRYFFNDELRLFYLSGKKETPDDIPDIYVPFMYNDEITPQEMNSMQQILSPNRKQIYLFIRDADSSSACYSITNGLIKPDSPETSKQKKNLERKKYMFGSLIENNRKLLYMKALKEQRKGKTLEEPSVSNAKV